MSSLCKCSLLWKWIHPLLEANYFHAGLSNLPKLKKTPHEAPPKNKGPPKRWNFWKHKGPLQHCHWKSTHITHYSHHPILTSRNSLSPSRGRVEAGEGRGWGLGEGEGWGRVRVEGWGFRVEGWGLTVKKEGWVGGLSPPWCKGDTRGLGRWGTL